MVGEESGKEDRLIFWGLLEGNGVDQRVES